MNKFRVGMPVYHYMQMNRVGTIVAVEDASINRMHYSTEGSPSVVRKAQKSFTILPTSCAQTWINAR